MKKGTTLAGAILALAMTPTPAAAAQGFLVDFVGWNKDAKPSAEQRKIAAAYLDATTRRGPLAPTHGKVAQVACVELAQDLVATHRFFQCRAVYEANAVDGGPFDFGRVLAWDGRRALLHRPTTRRDGPPLTLAPPGGGSAPDGRAAETVRGLEFASGDGARAEALDAALGAALAKRLAALPPERPLRALPAWLHFALAVHFDTTELTWEPGLASHAALERDFGAAAAGHASALQLARGADAKGFSGTARFGAGGSWAVFVVFDDPARGFAFRERTVAFRPFRAG